MRIFQLQVLTLAIGFLCLGHSTRQTNPTCLASGLESCDCHIPDILAVALVRAPALPAVPALEQPAAPAPELPTPAPSAPALEQPAAPAPEPPVPAPSVPDLEQPAAPALEPATPAPAVPTPSAPTLEQPAAPAPEPATPAPAAPATPEPAAPAPEPAAPAPAAPLAVCQCACQCVCPMLTSALPPPILDTHSLRDPTPAPPQTPSLADLAAAPSFYLIAGGLIGMILIMGIGMISQYLGAKWWATALVPALAPAPAPAPAPEVLAFVRIWFPE